VIQHERFRTMLSWPDELTVADRVELEGHLAGCSPCRQAASMYQENRERLRALAQIRPPEELRAAVLKATDQSHETAVLYAPLVLPMFILPITWVAIGAMIGYGIAGVAGVVVGILLFSALTYWHVQRREGAGSSAYPESTTSGKGLLLMLLADAVGALLGGLIFALVIMLLLFASGGHLH
jgi:predicted anti-sigma-YlaC factor YlaD